MPTKHRDAPPRARGADAARRLRKQWGNAEQPIADLFTEIESRTGIRVVRWPFPGKVDGGLFGTASRVMLINTQDRGFGRQRMTAAHELGHFEEDQSGEFVEAIDAKRPAEGFADGFAIEMLMPEQGLREWVKANFPEKPGAGDAARAAAYFVTSYEFAVIRLRELNLISKANHAEWLQVRPDRAAFTGGVAEWYAKGHAARGVRELPASYVSAARSAFASRRIKLERLAELEFDTIEKVRDRLEALELGGKAEGEAEAQATETALPTTGKRTAEAVRS